MRDVERVCHRIVDEYSFIEEQFIVEDDETGEKAVVLHIHDDFLTVKTAYEITCEFDVGTRPLPCEDSIIVWVVGDE